MMITQASRQTAYLLLAFVISSNVLGNILIKIGAEASTKKTILLGMFGWQLAAGIACFACGVLVYAFALRLVPLYVAQSVVVLQFVGVNLAAAVFFKESVANSQWLGIALIVAGLSLVIRQA